MLARPLVAVGLSRIVLLPALTGTLNVRVDQVLHAPVGSNAAACCTVVPLTITSAGRETVPPFAKRTPSVAVPPVGAVTVNCTWAPVALLPLQNPLPE